MNKIAMAVTVAAGVLAAFGADSTWTGAADGCWTNAANWTAGVPGRYYAPDGTLTGATAETATFGASAGATTIDLDGVYSIGEVIVTGATAPAYTFGTDADQTLPIEAVLNGSKNDFTVDASVVSMPTVVALLRLGVDVTSTDSSNGDTKMYVVNNAAQPLLINDFGSPQKAAKTGAKDPRCRAVFKGSGGGVHVKGVWKSGTVSASQSYISSGSAAGVTFFKDFTHPGLISAQTSGAVMTIANGVTIKLTQNGWGDFSNTLTINGPGTLSVPPGGFGQLYTTTQVITFNCRLTQTSVPTGDQGITFYGNGIYRLTNPANELSGKMRIYGQADAVLVLEMPKYGKIGEDLPLNNFTHILSADYLTVRFNGNEPDETDRTFGVVKHSSWNNNGHSLRMEQAGSADWTITTGLSLTTTPNDGFYKFYLQGDGLGKGIWKGVLADGSNGKLKVTKQGTGRWIYGNEMTYTGDTEVEAGVLELGTGGSVASSAVTLKGGALAVSGQDTKTLASLTVAGDCAVELADGASLSLTELEQTSGTLAVTTGDGATLTCAALAGQSPSWLKVNGANAEFDANGKLVKQTYRLTDSIPARGGVIPDGADKVVGITTAGTEGPITLEEDATTINTLVQRTDTEAVVSLASGRTLTVGTVALEENAAPLTIGAAPGEGTLSVPDSKLTVVSADPDSPITVNAAIDPSFSGTIEKTDAGELRLFSPYTFAGTLSIVAGTVVVTNDGAASLTGTLVGGKGTVFRVDGSGAYSSSAAQSGFDGDFVLNGGTLTMVGKDYGTVNQFGSLVGDLVVTNGGQMVLDGAQADGFTLNGKRVRYSGEGPDGRGALVSREFFNNMFQRITLDGDTVFSNEKGVKNPGYIVLSGKNGYAGCLDMQGHALKVTSPGPGRVGYFALNSATVTNAGPMRIENTILAVYSAAKLGGKDDPPITFGTNSQLTAYAMKRSERPIVVEADTEGKMNLVLNSPVALGDTNSYAFAGPWTFSPAAGRTGSVYFDQSGSTTNATVTFSGPVTGPGGFQLKPTLMADVRFTYPTNTFSGGITWSDLPGWTDTGYGAVVRFLYPGSLADYAQVTCDYGHSTVYMPNWPATNVLAFANRATLKHGATVAVDTSEAEGQTASLELSDAVIESEGFGLGHEGEGTLAVSGAWTKSPSLVAYGGKLEITGAGAKTLGVTRSQQDLRRSVIPELAIEDSGDVTISANGIQVGFGRVGAKQTGRQARMSVRNAKLVVPADTSSYPDAYFKIGYGCESGVLEIGDGAELACLPILGCYYSGYTGAGAGAIWQTGGKLVPQKRTGQANERFSIGYGDDCWGFYDLAGGELDAKAIDTRIAYGLRAAAVMRQTGGTAKFAGLYVGWANNGYASASYYMTGGTATCNGLQLPYVNYGGYGSRTTFTLDGDCTFTVSGTAGIPVAQAGQKNDTVDRGTVTIVNLMNGGTFSVKGRLSKSNSYDIMPKAVHAYVNFDGGTLASEGNGDLQAFDAGENAVDAVTSYGGGATFAVSGSKTVSVSVPVDAPKGNGVASVAWAGTAAAARTYIGVPAVDIYGDGYGASAVALFDRTTGRVTGIKVLTPGCNYTNAVAVIRPTAKSEHTFNSYLTNAVTLTSSAAPSGGLRKTGSGTLLLAATNTYTGATTVSGGTLKLGCDDALSPQSTLVLDGGTLDLNGRRATFAGIGGGAGKVVNGTVSIAGTWTVDLADLADGTCTELDGTVSFAPGTKARFLNTQLLEGSDRRSWKVLSAKGGIENPPEMEGTLPKGWIYRATEQGIRIKKDVGFGILIR